MAAPLPTADAAARGGLIPASFAADALRGLALPARVHARVRYTRLAGDRFNGTWRIDVDERRYVLRVRDPRCTLPGVDRERELAAQRCAARVGLAPEVLDGDAAAGWLLTGYVDAAPWTDGDLADAARLDVLAARLAALHALEPPAVAHLDAVAIADGQLELLRSRDPARAEQLEPHRAAIVQLGMDLDSAGEGRSLNHGDLVAANVLGAAAMLVDWEYAQVADATYDLACLLEYYPQARAHGERLIATLGQNSAAFREKLDLQQRRFRLLNELWHAAAAAGKMVGSTNQLYEPPK